MLANLGSTIQESIRYRGRSGHYTWLVHRLTGLGILAFLLIHAWDGSLLTFNPKLYSWTLEVFKTPFFGLGEIAVFGCVLFHSFNGLRISLLDWRPQWWEHQQLSTNIVWGIFLLLFIPLGGYLLLGVVESCSHSPVWADILGLDRSCFAIPPIGEFLNSDGDTAKFLLDQKAWKELHGVSH